MWIRGGKSGLLTELLSLILNRHGIGGLSISKDSIYTIIESLVSASNQSFISSVRLQSMQLTLNPSQRHDDNVLQWPTFLTNSFSFCCPFLCCHSLMVKHVDFQVLWVCCFAFFTLSWFFVVIEFVVGSCCIRPCFDYWQRFPFETVVASHWTLGRFAYGTVTVLVLCNVLNVATFCSVYSWASTEWRGSMLQNSFRPKADQLSLRQSVSNIVSRQLYITEKISSLSYAGMCLYRKRVWTKQWR